MKSRKVLTSLFCAFALFVQPAAQAKTNVHQEFKLMSDFIKALGENGIKCSPYKQDKEMLMVREGGICKWRGQSMDIAVFPSQKSLQSFRTAYKDLIGGYSFVEYNWMLNTVDERTAKIISKLIKSKIV